jgi:hypothetical protein
MPVQSPAVEVDQAPVGSGGYELDGYGRCPSCGENFGACPGVYHCLVCSED